MDVDGAKEKGAALAIVAGGILMAIGALMPWATVRSSFGSVSVSGFERGGDGVTCLILGAVATLIGGALLIGGDLPVIVARSPIPAGLVAGWIGFMSYSDIDGRVDDIGTNFVSGSVGPGVSVVIVGAGLALIGGLSLAYQRRFDPDPGSSGRSDTEPTVLPLLEDEQLNEGDEVTSTITTWRKGVGGVTPGDKLLVLQVFEDAPLVEVQTAEGRVGVMPLEELGLLPLPETKDCPRCAETVKAAAAVCRFCGYDFSAEA